MLSAAPAAAGVSQRDASSSSLSDLSTVVRLFPTARDWSVHRTPGRRS